MTDTVQKILLSMFGVVFGALVGFWVGIVTERHKQIVSKIIELKMTIIPTVNSITKGENLSAIPYENLQRVAGMLLSDCEKLKVVITGRKLKKLTSTWDAIFNITMTEKESVGYSKSHLTDTWTCEELDRLKEIQDALISRLEAFKKVVEKL